MKIRSHVINDGVIRLAVAGEIDLEVADDLYEALIRACHGAAGVVVDLAEVSLCDSTGIGVLVRAWSAAHRRGVDLIVINPRGIVRRSLQVTGVLDSLVRMQ
ncbi:STAS domain-containing protein [Actinoplanes xinjiangensis]|uniref:STAS domain-containing protein n=1 Tax=Actinoplanes xinjiangensis TaxID=512350 RepID=UPI003435BB84